MEQMIKFLNNNEGIEEHMEKQALQVYSRIVDVIKISSQFVLKSQLGVDSCTCKSILNRELSYNQYMAIMPFYGDLVKLLIKVHFMWDYGYLMASKVIKRPPDEITEDQVIDIIKEHCNILAGRSMDAFRKSGLTLGYSLPFAMQGFNEVFFKNIGSEYQDSFKNSVDNFSLDYSVAIDGIDHTHLPVIEDSVLANLQVKETSGFKILKKG